MACRRHSRSRGSSVLRFGSSSKRWFAPLLLSREGVAQNAGVVLVEASIFWTSTIARPGLGLIFCKPAHLSFRIRSGSNQRTSQQTLRIELAAPFEPVVQRTYHAILDIDGPSRRKLPPNAMPL